MLIGRFFVRLGDFWKLFLMVLALLCLPSCQKEASGNPVFLREASFCAMLEGGFVTDEGEELAFSASVWVDRRDGNEMYGITYREPVEMEGITVRVERERETGEERITAGLDGGPSLEVSHDTVKGWLMPVELLLSSALETPESLQKTVSGYRLSFLEKKILTVDEKGLPLSFQSPKIHLSVRNIRTLE
jgi:hypothetical protein